MLLESLIATFMKHLQYAIIIHIAFVIGEACMATKKYRIGEELLHKKSLGKNTLTQNVVSKDGATNSWCGTFFHYTSPEGLIGILQNRHLYFTDCQYLNDYNERIQINSELKKFWFIHKNEYDKDFYNLLSNEKISTYEDSEFAYIDGMEDPISCRYFVLSASRKEDSLDMWKYYAKNGTYDGYYINLNTYALVDEWIDRDTGVAVEEGDVIYYSDDKQKRILVEVEKLYDVWCKYKRSPELDAKIHSEFKCWLSYASLFFKNECFAQEDEYRFIAIAPKDELSSLTYEYKQKNIKMYDFRIVNGVIIPFIKMPICFWNEEECWAITRIGIGPSLNSELKEKGIKQLLASLDYGFGEMSIIKSEIPLRY